MKCGINSVKIGSEEVPYSKVAAALAAAEKSNTYSEAVEAGWVKLPNSVTPSAWEKWFKRIHLVNTQGNITAEDISGFDDNKTQRLKRLLNMDDYLETTKGKRYYKLLPETVNIIASYRRRLLEQHDLLNEDQVTALTDAIENVIWANNTTQKANATRNKAIASLNTKLGAGNKQYYNIFRSVLKIPLQAIKDPILKEKYLRVLGALSERTAVLSLKKLGSVLSDAKDIIANAQEFKQTEEELAALNSTDAKNDPVKHKFWSAAILNRLKQFKMPTGLTTDEKRIVKKLEGLTAADLDLLTHSQLRLLHDTIENVEGEVLPAILNDILWTVQAHKVAAVIEPVVTGMKPGGLSKLGQKLYGNLKKHVTKSNNALLEIIRSSPKHVVDEIFGSKGTAVFEETFGFLAKQQQQMELANLRLTEKTEKVEGIHKKFFKGKVNKVTKSIYKLKIYEKALEHASNPDQFSPMEYIQRIIDESHKDIFYTQYDRTLLEELIKEYAPNGEFDIKLLEASINPAEQQVLDHNRSVNDEKVKKVLFVSGVYRGQRVDQLVNYSPSNVIGESGQERSLDELVSRINGTSFGSKAANKRTATKAPLISLDVTGDVLKSAKEVNVEYYMAEPVRVTQRALTFLTKKLQNENASSLHQQGAAALQQALKMNIESNLGRQAEQYSFGKKVAAFFLKHGYAAQLASAPRAVAEFISNLGFALLNNPRSFVQGITSLSTYSMDAGKGQAIAEALRSKQISKLFGKGNYSGKFVEGSFFDYEGKQVRKAKSPMAARMEYIRSLLFDNKLANFPSMLADKALSGPDKMIARPIYFGEVASKFKEITGQEIDFEKVAAQDEAYMKLHEEALNEASNSADQQSILAGASNNPYAGISKLDKNPTDPFTTKAYKYVSGYLMRFMIYEASTFRTGVLSAVGQGRYSKAKGAQILAASSIRLGLYFPMYSYLAAAFAMLLGFDDDEKEKEDLGEAIQRDVFGGILTMMTQGRLTSLPRVPINFAIEHLNEKWGQDLRNGEEYDSYKHSIVFNMVSGRDFARGKSFNDLLMKFSGPLRPLQKDAAKIWDAQQRINSTKDPTKKAELEAALAKRYALMVAGHTGFAPFYKDMMRILNTEEYKAGKRAKAAKSSSRNRRDRTR